MWTICAGTYFTQEDVLGLRSLYQAKQTGTLAISDITEEQWEMIRVKADLTSKAWLRAINPVSEHQPKPFAWDDSPESCQSDR